VDLLWRGDVLEEARSWRRRYRGPLPPLQEEFLGAAFALATRATRIKRAGVAGTIAFLSLLVVAAAVALVTIRKAEHRATEQALLARASEQQVREQFDVLHEKELQRQEALRLASDATTAAGMSAEQLRIANEQLLVALAEADDAKRRIRQQLDDLQDKERQRKETLALAADASAEAYMSAEQLREVNKRLREALAESDLARSKASALLLESDLAKSQVSALLLEAENAKRRLAKALVAAERATKAAEQARDKERERVAVLEKEIGKLGKILK
jgi:hypothetical protein